MTVTLGSTIVDLETRVTAGACVCKHGRDAHDHYRGGTDCAVCPAGACNRYRTNSTARRNFRKLRGFLNR